MEEFVGKIVLPGDILVQLTSVEISALNSSKIIIGPGFRREAGEIIATKCGVVCKKNPSVYFVDGHQKRYVPVRGENVIGVVLKKSSEVAVVDIGSSEPATLSLLSFEGATKRNKPAVKVGDTVYAKIVVACKDMEPELVCVNSYGKSAGLGILDERGFVFTVPLEVSRKLLSPKMTILRKLGQTVPFEVAVGLNGRVWIKAKTTKQTLVLAQAINLTEHMTEKEAESIFNSMFECITVS